MARFGAAPLPIRVSERLGHKFDWRQTDSNNYIDRSIPPAGRALPRNHSDDRPEVGAAPTDPPQKHSVRQLSEGTRSEDVYRYTS